MSQATGVEVSHNVCALEHFSGQATVGVEFFIDTKVNRQCCVLSVLK